MTCDWVLFYKTGFEVCFFFFVFSFKIMGREKILEKKLMNLKEIA